MPEVYESTAGSMAIVLYIIIAIVALVFGAAASISQSPSPIRGLSAGAGMFCVVFVVCAILLNGVTYGLSYGTSPIKYMHLREFTKSQGLESGVAYPVAVGDRVGGSTGTAYVYGGIFSSSATVDVQPGSSISMSFRSGDKSYIFELPMSKVTFIETDDADGSVTFYLQNDEYAQFGDSTLKQQNCRTAIASTVLVRRCDYVPTYHPSAEAVRIGLAPVVATSLESVTIELSPELYQDILEQP